MSEAVARVIEVQQKDPFANVYPVVHALYHDHPTLKEKYDDGRSYRLNMPAGMFRAKVAKSGYLRSVSRSGRFFQIGDEPTEKGLEALAEWRKTHPREWR